MRLLVLAVLCFSLCILPAFAAQEGQQAPDVPKKQEVPFREDSGLITAEYYLATGKYAQALDVVNGVLIRHPDCADAFTYKGYAFEKLGDMKKAKESYKRAVEINPAHLGANTYLGKIYLREGDLDRALDELRVVRMTCGETLCQEVDELEAEVNRYREGQRDQPLAKQKGFVPGERAYYQE